MPALQCKGNKKDGTRCTKATNDPSGYCHLHVDQASTSSSGGGANSSGGSSTVQCSGHKADGARCQRMTASRDGYCCDAHRRNAASDDEDDVDDGASYSQPHGNDSDDSDDPGLNAQVGGMHLGGGKPQTLKFFHGTSWNRAMDIGKGGFLPSSDGCLGRGIYVAQKDKATRFAENTYRNGGDGGGGLIEVLITFKNPKYVTSDDDSWQRQGYDACRAEHTSASTNMEWCVKSDRQVEVVNIAKLKV